MDSIELTWINMVGEFKDILKPKITNDYYNGNLMDFL